MTTRPVFPCAVLPADPTEAKLLGLYPQRQQGLWMQRVKVPGGALTPSGWLTLAAVARKHTPGTPLQITTRQAIEFHNVTSPAVAPLQRDAYDAGFSGVGACGDTLRNITLCPGNGACEGSLDCTASAAAVQQALDRFPDIFNLPRKFKISFSACSNACAQPWINDLGFVASVTGSAVGICAIGAGSLGARPATGIMLRENLPAEHMPALACAAVRVFNAYGDRHNRRTARLRHVRERVGDTTFLDLLNHEFDLILSEGHITGPPAQCADSPSRPAVRLSIPYGCVDDQLAAALAELGSDLQGSIRIENHHSLAVFSSDCAAVLQAVGDSPVLRPLLNGPDIVACPGTTFCKHALVDTRAVETRLRRELPAGFARAIRISGCPNGCAHTAVAEIGLSGRLRRNTSSSPAEGFHLYTGGGMGSLPELAISRDTFVPARDIVDRVKTIDMVSDP